MGLRYSRHEGRENWTMGDCGLPDSHVVIKDYIQQDIEISQHGLLGFTYVQNNSQAKEPRLIWNRKLTREWVRFRNCKWNGPSICPFIYHSKEGEKTLNFRLLKNCTQKRTCSVSEHIGLLNKPAPLVGLCWYSNQFQYSKHYILLTR